MCFITLFKKMFSFCALLCDIFLLFCRDRSDAFLLHICQFIFLSWNIFFIRTKPMIDWYFTKCTYIFLTMIIEIVVNIGGMLSVWLDVCCCFCTSDSWTFYIVVSLFLWGYMYMYLLCVMQCQKPWNNVKSTTFICRTYSS
jgi:hypothetical protein